LHRYIAVVSASEEQRYATRLTVLERERDFFLRNPLLQGLRADRWGTVTLKNLLVRFQVRLLAFAFAFAFLRFCVFVLRAGCLSSS
jgi:hypothetical protein